jgi:hypothetical protein
LEGEAELGAGAVEAKTEGTEPGDPATDGPVELVAEGENDVHAASRRPTSEAATALPPD